MELVLCRSCYKRNAMPDGNKSPSGHPTCNSCFAKITKKIAKSDKPRNNSGASWLLKNNPVKYANCILHGTEEGQ